MPDAMKKAYIARSDEECVIVFGSRNDMALRRLAAGQMTHGDAECIDSLERAPEFDQFGSVDNITFQDYLQRGWFFACMECGCEVNEETEAPVAQEEGGQRVWCSQTCKDAMMQADAERKAQEAAEKARMTEMVNKLWPGVVISHIGRRHWDKPETLEAHFTFPGQVTGGHVTWVEKSLVVSVPKGDVDAWIAFKESLTVFA